MARKKRFGITSVDRYRIKAYRVHYMPGIPEDIVRMVASNQTAAWMGGFGIYSRAWNEKVKGILKRHNIPSLMWGPYRAFINEFISKVVEKGTQDPEAVIRKYADMGLNELVLREIVEYLPAKKPENE